MRADMSNRTDLTHFSSNLALIYGLAFSFVFTGLIWLAGEFWMDPGRYELFSSPRKAAVFPQMWYLWQLEQPTFWTRATAWGGYIAHNLVIDYHRKKKPVALPDTDTLRLQAHAAPDLTEDQVVFEQDIVELVEAVQRLDEKEQLIVILRFVEGLSHREVAKMIGKSEVHSRVLQHRALAKLQGYLSDGKDI